jgi:hypothetical protein
LLTFNLNAQAIDDSLKLSVFMMEKSESLLFLSTHVLDLFDMSLSIREPFLQLLIVSFQALNLIAQVIDAPGIEVRWRLRGFRPFEMLNTSISSRKLLSMQDNCLGHLLDLSRKLTSIRLSFVFPVLNALA